MPLDLQNIYNETAKEIETILQFQAPVDTGLLRKSIKVTVNKEGIDLEFEPANYWNFTDDGTGSYYEESEDIFAHPWNPNPGKGDKGIKPRHWTNYGKEVDEKMELKIDEAINAYLNETWDII